MLDTQTATTFTTMLPIDHPCFPRHILGADQDAMHKFVMMQFPEKLVGADRTRRAENGILYRLESRPDGDRILIQSFIKPERIVDGDGYGARIINSSTLIESAAKASYVRFSVDINAIVRGKHGVRSVLPPEIHEWLTKRMDQAVSEVEIVDSVMRTRTAHGNPLKIASITAQAAVLDSDEWRGLLLNGLGRAKTYGCGLIVARGI